MRIFAALTAFTALFNSVAATKWLPTRTVPSVGVEPRSDAATAPAPFVSVVGGQFVRNGKPFKYTSINAHWLQGLSDANINATVKDIASKNITVIRTWAFNDVTEIPKVGPWITNLAPNGTITFNNDTNGFGRIRSILNAAQANDIMVQLVLTNNWSAFNISNITITLQNGTQIVNPIGSYSQSFGGSDVYVQFNNLTDHAQFYANQTVIKTFTNNLQNFIPALASHPNVLAWEVANDARCNGTMQDPNNAIPCDTTTITDWHSTVSKQVQALDPNHLISAGVQGFLCQIPSQCPKHFFTQAPTPLASPGPGARRRSLNEKSIIAERQARWKRTAEAAKQQRDNAAEKQSRGLFSRWSPRNMFGRDAAADTSIPSHIKRQSATVGSAMDGSFGVDSLDIGAIPQLGFVTFQLFPDQNVYEVADPSLSAAANTIQAGISWIETQATIGQMLKKPVVMSSGGLVTQTHAPFFIDFNGTSLVFPNSSAIPTTLTGSQVGILQGQAPVNDSLQAMAYQSWSAAAISNGLSGIGFSQWGTSNLQPPTPTQGTSNEISGTFSPALPATQGISPDDGYQLLSPQIQAVLQAAAINVKLANEIEIPSV